MKCNTAIKQVGVCWMYEKDCKEISSEYRGLFWGGEGVSGEGVLGGEAERLSGKDHTALYFILQNIEATGELSQE